MKKDELVQHKEEFGVELDKKKSSLILRHR